MKVKAYRVHEMKDPSYRTKVVVRHLPPSLSQSSFFEQIEARFSGHYNWSSFRSGKHSSKIQKYARAYINFNTPDDVYDFADFFNGHVFVNEKGAQFKAIVEYSPSQRVPKTSSKKDGREGTIVKDPEYVEFLEHISKPTENLPSADIQLERREAERAGVVESPVVTPLMEYVRKKRAAKSGLQATTSDGKVGRRLGLASPNKARSSTTKQGSEKRKYILKAGGKSTNGKGKSTYILVPQGESKVDYSSGKDLVGNESGSVSTSEAGKKTILLLKGREQETSQVSGSALHQTTATIPSETLSGSTSSKLNQRHDASGRIIRSILLNKEPRRNQSSLVHSEQNPQVLNSDKGKRPPRPSTVRSMGSSYASANDPVSSDSVGKKAAESKGHEPHGLNAARDKQEKRSRNKERLDRGVWTPLRRSDASPTHDEHAVQHKPNVLDTHEGSHRQYGRRGPPHTKDEGSPSDWKSTKRGAASHSVHEKQVWVQKSSSGS